MLKGAETPPMRTSTPTQNQLRLLRTVTVSLLFFRFILQSNLKKSTRGHHVPIFRRRNLLQMVVWLTKFHKYSAELRPRTRCYPVHTSWSTTIDTYSRFNVEPLLITISFLHLFIFARLFSLVFSLQAACLQNLNVMAQVTIVTCPMQSLVAIPLSKKQSCLCSIEI